MVTDALRFNAWGQVREHDGDTPAAHRFAGEYWEDALGLSFNRARWYSPDVARFTSVDPWTGSMAVPQTLSDYAYVQNNPVLYIDPTGWIATISDATLGSALSASLSTGAQVTFRVVLRKVGRELMCIAVEEIVELAVIEALTGGIYVLVEAGDLYAGKTGDFDRRQVQHAKNMTRQIERTLARFHFDGKGNDLRLLEQFFMDFLRQHDFKLTNKLKAIRERGGSMNTRQLRAALAKLDFCK